MKLFEYEDFSVSDYELVKSLNGEVVESAGVDIHELDEELSKAMKREGLVQKEVTVRRKDGSTYSRMQWVRSGKGSTSTPKSKENTKTSERGKKLDVNNLSEGDIITINRNGKKVKAEVLNPYYGDDRVSMRVPGEGRRNILKTDITGMVKPAEKKRRHVPKAGPGSGGTGNRRPSRTSKKTTTNRSTTSSKDGLTADERTRFEDWWNVDAAKEMRIGNMRRMTKKEGLELFKEMLANNDAW